MTRTPASSPITSLRHNPQQQHSFTINMIAKLASNNGAPSRKAAAGQGAARSAGAASASQSKKKRSKLLDLLLNSNWSKQSHQASNLLKLNKILIVCDANFLDEKTGESPISLAISSPQINQAHVTSKTSRLPSVFSATTSNGCPQSTSLFDLQSQHSTASHNLLTLQQTSAFELSQSKAPLVERVLLVLIKSGASIDFRNHDGRTPLHVAAMKSNFWALKTLLDLELKVTQLLLNHMGTSQRNPPSLAFVHHQKQPEVACREGMEISDQHGWQAIHYAAKYGLSGHLEKLLYHGCDTNAKISGSGNTPLHVAAINDQLQVAVIASNMNLAEFIAGHDETKVVPFRERPNNMMLVNEQHSPASLKLEHLPNEELTRSSPTSVPQQSTISSPQQPTGTLSKSSQDIQRQSLMVHKTGAGLQLPSQEPRADQPVRQLLQQHALTQQSTQRLNPLTLDVVNHHSNSITSSAPTTNTSGSSQQTGLSSLLSIDSTSSLHNNQLNVQANNISPCLSQQSCATSNTTTTSSSGVCCDGEGAHHLDETLGVSGKSGAANSNITIISIGNGAKESGTMTSNPDHSHQRPHPRGADESALTRTAPPRQHGVGSTVDRRASAFKPQHHILNSRSASGRIEGEDLSGSGSESSDELYSLMSQRKPLFVGSIVSATNCYESGDPRHLQLRREDLVEVLDCPADLVVEGQLPKLANKPMLYGRRLSDGSAGLFPSFCVRRTKQKLTAPGQQPMQDVTNISNGQRHGLVTANESQRQQSAVQAMREKSLPESRSMIVLGIAGQHQATVPASNGPADQHESAGVNFRQFPVALSKFQNDGFGFVLRGARIDPATVSEGAASSSIDERLMAANKLASLQYFSDIEPNSVAHQSGLKRGDFLVSVNNQDVRLCSHEQVVQMIRQSGDEVLLTVARPLPLIAPGSSQTLARVKPEPPKRDPTTTLTRNKAPRVKSTFVAPQLQQQQQQQQQPLGRFDADKPLPETPHSGMVGQPPNLSRSLSNNLSHFHSVTSLSLSVAPDAESISSISTAGYGHGPDSSSSTATLTTVATTKPRAPPKPERIDLDGAIRPADEHHFPRDHHQSASVPTAAESQSNVCPAHPVESRQSGANGQNSDGLQTPIPPPPPPPLPDFSLTPTKDRLKNRRTSAPIEKTTPLIQIGKEQLSKKRESLAVVANDVGTGAIDGVAAICTVAAACAAAANSRLQRRLQEQNQEQKNPILETPSSETGGRVIEKTLKASGDDMEVEDHNSSETLACHKMNDLLMTAAAGNIETNQTGGGMACQRTADKTQEACIHRCNQSATLGRKSSAQIIQQPKPNSNVGHSQTLRVVSTKRASILAYDAFAAPPPSIPPPVPKMFTEQEVSLENPRASHPTARDTNQIQRQQSQGVSHRDHQQYQLYQQQKQPQAQQHQCVRHSLTRAVADFDRNTMSQMHLQDQHQFLIHQQQQLRQRQIQEQMRLQQLQQQQRCRHEHRAEYGYQPNFEALQAHAHQHKHQSDSLHHMLPRHHHHHRQHLQAHQDQTPRSLSSLQQQQLALDEQRAAQHRHHHHHHHRNHNFNQLTEHYPLQHQQQYMQGHVVDPQTASMNR